MPSNKNTPALRPLSHLLFWVAFVAYEQLTYYLLYHKFGTLGDQVLNYALNISLSYGIYRALGRSGLWRPAGLLLVMAVYLLLKFGYNHFFFAAYARPGKQLEDLHSFLIVALYRAGIFFFIGLIYWALSRVLTQREAVAEARNAFLQQQMDPHLLFNSLSFVYSKVHELSEDGARVIDLLTGILRFSSSGTGPDGKCRLNDELEQVRNLVEIGRYRFGTGIQLHADIRDDRNDLRVIPLILLTLTENIFKHGDLRAPAELRAQVQDGLLTFHSSNKKRIRGAGGKGIGLHHSRLRLEHAYGKAYHLDTVETADHFQLTLTIQL